MRRRDLAATLLVTIFGVWAAVLLPKHPIVGGIMGGAVVVCAFVIGFDVANERAWAKIAASDPSDTRVFTNLSPRRIRRIYRRPGTELQGERAVAHLTGTWLRVSGFMFDLGEPSPLDGTSLVELGLLGLTGVSLRFGAEEVKRLEALKRRSRIHVAGKIRSVSRGLVGLGDCQLERRP